MTLLQQGVELDLLDQFVEVDFLFGVVVGQLLRLGRRSLSVATKARPGGALHHGSAAILAAVTRDLVVLAAGT